MYHIISITCQAPSDSQKQRTFEQRTQNKENTISPSLACVLSLARATYHRGIYHGFRDTARIYIIWAPYPAGPNTLQFQEHLLWSHHKPSNILFPLPKFNLLCCFLPPCLSSINHVFTPSSTTFSWPTPPGIPAVPHSAHVSWILQYFLNSWILSS